MSVDRNVLVASHDATIRAMIVINNFVGDQALLTAGDDLALRNFRLPECQENPTKYGEEESHMGAGTEPFQCAADPSDPPFLASRTSRSDDAWVLQGSSIHRVRGLGDKNLGSIELGVPSHPRGPHGGHHGTRRDGVPP